MKKYSIYLLIMFFGFVFTSKAEGIKREMTSAEKTERVEVLTNRVNELRRMDFSKLDRKERRMIRKELKQIDKEVNSLDLNSPVTISLGALIIIILLLIIIF